MRRQLIALGIVAAALECSAAALLNIIPAGAGRHRNALTASRRVLHPPVANEGDGLVLAAAALAAGLAGYLQYSVSAGDKGINAFLMKEKGANPFYSKDYKSDDRPSGGPRWLQKLKLPEVHGPCITVVPRVVTSRATAAYSDCRISDHLPTSHARAAPIR